MNLYLYIKIKRSAPKLAETLATTGLERGALLFYDLPHLRPTYAGTLATTGLERGALNIKNGAHLFTKCPIFDNWQSFHHRATTYTLNAGQLNTHCNALHALHAPQRTTTPYTHCNALHAPQRPTRTTTHHNALQRPTVPLLTNQKQQTKKSLARWYLARR